MPPSTLIKWVPIEGDADIGDEEIRFDPTRGAKPQVVPGGIEMDLAPYAVLASNRYFQRGRVSFGVFLHEESSRCQFVLNRGLGIEIVVGFNVANAAYGIITFKPGIANLQPAQWGSLALAKVGFRPPHTTLGYQA
jgi:hypothetical protein